MPRAVSGRGIESGSATGAVPPSRRGGTGLGFADAAVVGGDRCTESPVLLADAVSLTALFVESDVAESVVVRVSERWHASAPMMHAVIATLYLLTAGAPRPS